jgi:putative ABC transport system permease protein
METLCQDVRYAARSLLKNQGFTLVVIFTLALGIGANTAIFSFVNALLLRPLPYRDSDRLVQIVAMRGGEPGHLSLREIQDMQEQLQIFQEIAAYDGEAQYNMSGDGLPEEITATICTGNLLQTLGIPLLHGQFWPKEYDRQRNFGVVLNHDFWLRRFGGDPGIIGQKVSLDSAPFYTVFGILPPGVHFPSNVDLFRSHGIVANPQAYEDRGNRNRFALARLKQDISFRQAQANLDNLGRRLEQNYPDTNRGISFRLTPLRDLYVRDLRPYLWVLLAAVAFVLLIACVNVANLSLSRVLAREREIAIRTALGAGRRRLVQLFLTESLLVSLLGGAAGLLVSYWSVSGLARLVGKELPWWIDVRIDIWVLGFTFLISLLTGILAGLTPSLQPMNLNLNELLKESARGSSTGPARHQARRWLVVSEIALALVLLIGASLMVKSFLRLQQVDLGFNSDQLLTFRVALPWRTYSGEKTIQFYEQLIEGLRVLPGVETVAANSNLPLTGEGKYAQQTIMIEGQSLEDQQRNPFVIEQRISPDYFRLMRIPLVKGRFFNKQDGITSTPVAIISQRMADQFWGGQDPFGKRLMLGKPGAGQVFSDSMWLTVIGVVSDVRHEQVTAEPGLSLYTPYTQSVTNNQYVLLRMSVDPMTVAEDATRAVWAVDPNQSTFNVRTMKERIAETTWQREASSTLFVAFAAMALILAATGIYGVISYTVGQRTREIGIRIALGAQRRDVFKMVLGDAMKLAAMGGAAGLLGALALTRLMTGLLYQVSATDPWTFVFMLLVLTGVGLAAGYLPARRATKVDPIVALRME